MTWEFKRRVAFTVGALLIYRLGCYIPLPGINPAVWDQLFRAPASGDLGLLLLSSGGGLRRLAIFALNITPYISAAVLVQLATIASARLRALNSQGRSGRQIVRSITLGLTILVAALQAYGVAVALERVNGIVANPGWVFIITTIITLTGGVLFLAWLSEQITLRGIGNGIALILLSGAVPALWVPIVEAVELGRRGLVSSNVMVVLVVLVVVVTGFVVLMERAERRLPIQYSRRQADGRVIENLSSYLPIKLNSAGIIPIILASWALSLLIAFLNLFTGQALPWLTTVATRLANGQPLYLILFAILIVVCTFFYAAYVLDPEATAKRLRHNGGAMPSIQPGEPTASHIDYVLSRTTVIGAAYLTLIVLMPEILIKYMRAPFYLGGQSLLILVCTMLDLSTQVRGELRLLRR